jgi:hypothetical protein
MSGRVPSRIGGDTVHGSHGGCHSGRPQCGRPERSWFGSDPGGIAIGHDLAYQSTAFQVGPAWVGFAKKLPSFGLARSTFFR